jgi:hypothetical protein
VVIFTLKNTSSKAASILGSKSGWTCPTCLVPHNLLWDLSDVIYPLRSRDGTLRLIEKAKDCTTKAGAYEVLLTQSIRNIPVFIFSYQFPMTDFYFRIHSSTTSACIWLCTVHSVQMYFTKLSKESGANMFGR